MDTQSKNVAAYLDDIRLVDRNELAKCFGVALCTIDKLRDSDPDFPRPIQISDRRLAWRVGTVAAWLAGRERAQSNTTA